MYETGVSLRCSMSARRSSSVTDAGSDTLARVDDVASYRAVTAYVPFGKSPTGTWARPAGSVVAMSCLVTGPTTENTTVCCGMGVQALLESALH